MSIEPELEVVQEWEGFVVAIQAETFNARLLDVTAGDRYDSAEATIPLEALSDEDRERIAEGSIFSWVIGQERAPAGSGRHVSRIVLCDLRVTPADERSGRRWAREMMDKFGL